MNNNLCFKSGKFKIMQIADIQEDVPVNPDTIKLITLAIEKEQPDLIVLTGDQVQGYSACYRKDALNKVRECIYSFCSVFKNKNIPFTMTFGNHDDDCKISKNTQLGIYGEFDNFIKGESHNENDPGTHALQIFDSSNSKAVFNLYLIDSNKKNSIGTYEAVRKDQLDWLKEKREELKSDSGDYLHAFIFQHIPVPEFYDALIKAPKKIKGSVEAFNSRKNTFWTLPESSLEKGDFMYESPAVPEENTGEFEVLKEKGDVLGIFVGHDHNNSFVVNKDGIDMGYCQGAGFNTYGPGADRGVRVFVLDENDTKSYETYTITMNQLCDFKPSKPIKEFVFRNMPSSVNDATSLAKRVLPPVALAGITLAAIRKITK